MKHTIELVGYGVAPGTSFVEVLQRAASQESTASLPVSGTCFKTSTSRSATTVLDLAPRMTDAIRDLASEARSIVGQECLDDPQVRWIEVQLADALEGIGFNPAQDMTIADAEDRLVKAALVLGLAHSYAAGTDPPRLDNGQGAVPKRNSPEIQAYIEAALRRAFER